MAEHRTAAVMEALASVYDPCCQEKGLSVVDMGLVRKVDLDGDQARVELLLTTGWCPFAANLVGQITERVAALPGMAGSTVEVVWDEPWTTDRLSDKARRTLRFCPTQGGRPVIGNDAIVFDGVAHIFNFEKKNALGPAGEMFINHLYAFHNVYGPGPDAPGARSSCASGPWIDEMVYEHSTTDMLCAMPLPLTDLFRDGLSPWEECAELAARRPDRTVFWGSVNPLEAATPST